METTTNRRLYIGASEVSAILGLNPFCTPLKLYALKKGLIERPEQSEAAEWGHRLERVVSDKFAEKNGVKLIAYKKRFIHPDLNYFSCELDNIIAGTNELVEVKTVNAWDMKKLAEPDQIPQHFLAQVTAQLGLSGRMVGHIAILVGGQKYVEKKVIFDPVLYNTIVERVKGFWKMVVDSTPPMAMADDNETLLEIYPTTNELIQPVEELNDAIGTLQATKGHIASLQAERDEIEAKIKQVIGDNLGIKTSEYIVKWPVQSSTRLDTEAIKAAGLYEQYSKKSETRVLRVSKNNESQKNCT